MDGQAIRVLVVDDSALMRGLLCRLINEGRGLQVVGEARDGREALERIAALRPDVVTLDIEMPVLDGVQTLEALMRRHPVPVVMLSNLTRRGAEITLRCLELGAVDFLPKPTAAVTGGLAALRYLLWQKLREAAQARVQSVSLRAPRAEAPVRACKPAQAVVALGASTGGPQALLEVLASLPAALDAGVLVVQHMPSHFTAAMAQRLDAACALQVREAQAGERIARGVALIAPGGAHLRLDPGGQVRLTDEPPRLGVRPSVDLMMTDAASVYGAAVLGVLLTGMGRDGVEGLAAIKRAHGMTLAQDEATSVIYGMPRAAIEAGVADQVAPLPEIAGHIARWCQAWQAAGRSHDA